MLFSRPKRRLPVGCRNVRGQPKPLAQEYLAATYPQAYLFAMPDGAGPASVGTSLYGPRNQERTEARNYFAAMTRDFQHVCNLAGLDADTLLAMMQARIRLSDEQQPASKPKSLMPSNRPGSTRSTTSA